MCQHTQPCGHSFTRINCLKDSSATLSSLSTIHCPRRRRRAHFLSFDTMYAPPSPRPRPKVAIPGAPKRRPTHRAPFPSWLPDPNTSPAVHDEPYDDDADTPLQRTVSDSGTRHHGSRHGTYRALPPLPADTSANFLTEQPYTPSSSTPLQSIDQAQPYSNLYYPPSYEYAQQRPASFAEGTSSYNPNGGSMSFPEPELHRSFSTRSYHEYEPPPHRHTNSDIGPSAGLARSTSYAASFSDVSTPRVSFRESATYGCTLIQLTGLD